MLEEEGLLIINHDNNNNNNNKQHPNTKQAIGVLGLVAVGYFWVSGGMYGMEPVLDMGPPA